MVTEFTKLSMATYQVKIRSHVIEPRLSSESIKDPMQEKSPKVPTSLLWMFTQVPTNAYFREEVFLDPVVKFVPCSTVHPDLPKVVLIAVPWGVLFFFFPNATA